MEGKEPVKKVEHTETEEQPREGESKNAFKARLKAERLERERAEKAAKKAAEEAAKGDKPAKKAEEEELDPTAYYENRSK